MRHLYYFSSVSVSCRDQGRVKGYFTLKSDLKKKKKLTLREINWFQLNRSKEREREFQFIQLHFRLENRTFFIDFIDFKSTVYYSLIGTFKLSHYHQPVIIGEVIGILFQI